jgi:hypothetical protein
MIVFVGGGGGGRGVCKENSEADLNREHTSGQQQSTTFIH